MTDRELFELIRINYSEINKDYLVEQATKACEHCSNNPKNGGSGICQCILAERQLKQSF